VPKVALADTLTDWNSLIANAGPLAEGDPQLTAHLDALRARLDHARDTADRRRHLEGQLRQATQDLAADTAEGKNLAFRIRAKLKAIHGPTSPMLHAYGITPRPASRNADRLVAAPAKPKHPAPAPPET
jgi:hypothetical protein